MSLLFWRWGQWLVFQSAPSELRHASFDQAKKLAHILAAIPEAIQSLHSTKNARCDKLESGVLEQHAGLHQCLAVAVASRMEGIEPKPLLAIFHID
ncbi:MAG: urease accessory UreF family protein [Burkholderiales bacterium]